MTNLALVKKAIFGEKQEMKIQGEKTALYLFHEDIEYSDCLLELKIESSYARDVGWWMEFGELAMRTFQEPEMTILLALVAGMRELEIAEDQRNLEEWIGRPSNWSTNSECPEHCRAQ